MSSLFAGFLHTANKYFGARATIGELSGFVALDRAKGPIPIGELQRTCGLPPATLYRRIQEAEDRGGIILLTDDPDDARKSLIQLHPAARAHTAKFKCELREAIRVIARFLFPVILGVRTTALLSYFHLIASIDDFNQLIG